MLRLNSGSGNLNVVERLKKMKPGLDTHWMPPTKKCIGKFGLVYCGRRIQVEEIVQVLGISHASVSTVT